MLTQRKHKPPKAMALPDAMDKVYRHFATVAKDPQLNHEFRYAMAYGALVAMQVINGCMTGKMDCPSTHKLLDKVITDHAIHWAAVDPEAQFILEAMKC